ncbi:DUF72 domain-containing protein [Desulfosoma sp.]
MHTPYRIGTSGWNYAHWRGRFYPEKLQASKWLAHYATHFDTVECNATFYRLPSEKTFRAWKTSTPEGFLWALKASRLMTHYRRLQDVRDPLEQFLSHARLLGEKLGPVLFQLPPSLHYDESITTSKGTRSLTPCASRNASASAPLRIIRTKRKSSVSILFCVKGHVASRKAASSGDRGRT